MVAVLTIAKQCVLEVAWLQVPNKSQLLGVSFNAINSLAVQQVSKRLDNALLQLETAQQQSPPINLLQVTCVDGMHSPLQHAFYTLFGCAWHDIHLQI